MPCQVIQVSHVQTIRGWGDTKSSFGVHKVVLTQGGTPLSGIMAIGTSNSDDVRNECAYHEPHIYRSVRKKDEPSVPSPWKALER